jgi:hypothetical protein
MLRAIRLPEVLAATNFVARSKTDPDAARAELRGAIEPRIITLGRPASFRPLLIVLVATTIVTMTRGWWCRLL